MQTDQDTTTQAAIIAGLLYRKQLAAALHRSERTVVRWERAGLPVIKLGMTRLYNLANVHAWLMTHEQRHDAPKRGRPANRAA